MSDTTFYYVIGALIVILAVLLFNSYQEKRYRDEVRRQFGYADQDALLEGKREQVRDGQGVFNAKIMGQYTAQNKAATDTATDESKFAAAKSIPPVSAVMPDIAPPPAVVEEAVADDVAFKLEPMQVADETSFAAEPNAVVNPADVAHQAEEMLDGRPVNAPRSIKDLAVPTVKSMLSSAKSESGFLLDLQDLTQVDLPWFDNRVDYMAYVSLRTPMELHTMPRLSNKHRFVVAACTMDGRFQLAEPIPSVYYQGFVAGMQCISRKGLAERDDLLHFAEQVRQFAAQMGGGVAVANVEAFMQVAEPMDELCVRVDQTIAIHLVSREQVSGREIKAALEDLHFELDQGVFWYRDAYGKNLFSAVNLDSTPFIAAALGEQSYRGFSMLFDLTKVPAGEKTFNQFMDLVVKLSSHLGLDLVDDQLHELSTQWLKDIRSYVVERQDEMHSVEIEPGSELAERLFS